MTWVKRSHNLLALHFPHVVAEVFAGHDEAFGFFTRYKEAIQEQVGEHELILTRRHGHERKGRKHCRRNYSEKRISIWNFVSN